MTSSALSRVFIGVFVAVLVGLTPIRGAAAATGPRFELKAGDRVVLLGDTLIEREQQYGWIELMLTARFPDREVTFRNLGWSGDTPAGDSRFGLSLLQAGREPADEGWNQLVKQIEDAKPTVVILGYGMADSFSGEAGREKFKTNYQRLLDTITKISPSVRFVLLGPVRHETMGAPFADPAAHNVELDRTNAVVREIAAQRHAVFFSLYDALRKPMERAERSGGAKLTDNGIHLNSAGYRFVAEALEDHLLGDTPVGAWRTSVAAEPLRQAILKKNEWFFFRSRPENMAYIFGFRKKEQGNNAGEVLKFDEFITNEEKRIGQLRALRPGVNVPEVVLRVGNLNAKHTLQPRPNFTLADGLEATLWAENPLLHKPTQMNFDPQGRLWIASSEVYPQIEPGQAPSDKIIVLEDTTGAGHADKATVFADGLLIPTGVEPGDGGVYVAQSTELLFFKDTDGDGKADVRRTVLSGFGTEDTHHNLHTLRWGPDGRLYMNQSVYTRTDAETPNGVVRLKAGGMFRFDTRDQKMEILYRGWVNAWGHQFDDFGQSFVTDGAGFQGVSWAVPGATYRTLAPARRELASVSPGAYPKFSGIEIIRSPLFPDDWQGDIITCDFRAHRVVHFKISEQGSAFITREMPDMMRTTDGTFRPLDAKLGPDGALYIADWSNPIIQHGEVDFRDPRRDKEHGRIWRITAKGRAALPKVDFTKLDNTALLDRLLSKNGYEQAQAKRVLVERGAAKVQSDLAIWTSRHTDTAGKFQAIWANEAFNLPSGALIGDVLKSDDARFRAAVVRAMPVAGSLAPLTKLVAEVNPRVRLEAVRALGKLGTAQAAEVALTVLDKPMDAFLDYALWLTMNELAEPWLAAVRSGSWNFQGKENQLAFGLKAVEPTLAVDVLAQLLTERTLPRDGSGPWIELIASAGGPHELRRLFDALLVGGFDDAAAVRALTALTEASRLRAANPEGDLAKLGTLLESAPAKVRVAVVPLVGAWKLTALAPALVQFAGAPDTVTAERTAAFAALRDLGGASVITELRRLTREGTTPVIRREAVVALAGVDLPGAMPDVLAVLTATTDEGDAQALWRALLAVRGASGRLAADLQKTKIPVEVARAGLRPAREGGQHQALVQTLIKSARLSLSDAQLTPAEMQTLAKQALATGDAVRGERLYRRPDLACMACHAIGGAGGKVGPDLTSIGASAPTDYLVESLIYPNAKIKEGYHSVIITTKDAQELSGVITKETATEITLRNAANIEVPVAVKNIAKRISAGSLMPAGLIDGLVPEERLDLVKFLSQLGRPGDFDAAKGGVARSWNLYSVTAKNQEIGIRRVVGGDPVLDDWVPMITLVSGVLPGESITATYPSFTNTRGLYAATRFESARAGMVIFTLVGDVKDAWINGASVKPGAQFTAEVRAGTNTLVLQLNEAGVAAGIKLSAADVSFNSN
jgi:putative heme-binding domain-containing protein